MIVKNKPGTPDAPIPPGTLSQAGTFTVATSSAWDSKALMGAWWVKAEQVSKISATGDYIATGDVAIRGEKNHLAPGQLVLGFAVLFHISDESIQNHASHRNLGYEDSAGQGSETHGRSLAAAAGERKEDSHELVETCEEILDSRLPAETDEPQQAKSSLQDDGAPHESEENSTESRRSQEEHQSALAEDTGSDGQAKDMLMGGDEALEAEESDGEDDEENQDGSVAEEKQVGPQPSRTSGTSTPSKTPSVISSKQRQQTRGKRGKAKKLAAKYKDQDEEDRQLALRLLGSAPKAEGSSTAAASTRTDKIKTKAEREAEVEALKQRRRAQHERAAEAEWRRQEAIKRGEDLVEGAEEADEHADLSCLPSLIGDPVPADEILAAIPVCAPWSAVSPYKYRVKLQPGPIKKGKAVREVVSKWIADGTAKEKQSAKDKGKKPVEEAQQEQDEASTSVPNAQAQERALASTELELIKGWKSIEGVNALPVGGVKIVVAGAGGEGIKAGDKGKGKADTTKGSGKGGKGGRGGKKK
jgi:hypothetical protein